MPLFPADLADLDDFVQKTDVDGILGQLVDDAFWCDILSLTWDLCTFFGHDCIQ